MGWAGELWDRTGGLLYMEHGLGELWDRSTAWSAVRK